MLFTVWLAVPELESENMPRNFKTTSQPPIDRERRSCEARRGWIGLLFVMFGLLLILCGAFLSRDVRTDGDRQENLSEPALIRAATTGALQRISDSATEAAGQESRDEATEETRQQPVVRKIQTGDDFCPT